MDRRVLLLAEPAPLVGELVEVGQAAANYADPNPKGKTRDCHRRRSKVLLDLRHLRAAIDDLSVFCLTQENLVASSSSSNSTGSRPTSPPAPPSRSLILGMQADSASQRPTVGKHSSGNEDKNSRTVLLAAVFPCPALAELDTSDTTTITNSTTATTTAADTTTYTGASDRDHSEDIGGSGVAVGNNTTAISRVQQHPSNDDYNGGTDSARIEPPPSSPTTHRQPEDPPRRAAALASAFADALDGCGLWLRPKDFEARVLAPTRALLDLQLDILDPSSAAVPTDNAAAAETAENISQEMAAFFAPITASAAESFVRDAAEEVLLLLEPGGAAREAGVRSGGGVGAGAVLHVESNRSGEGKEEGGGGGGRGGVGHGGGGGSGGGDSSGDGAERESGSRRRVAVDVIWVAASSSVRGKGLVVEGGGLLTKVHVQFIRLLCLIK